MGNTEFLDESGGQIPVNFDRKNKLQLWVQRAIQKLRI